MGLLQFDTIRMWLAGFSTLPASGPLRIGLLLILDPIVSCYLNFRALTIKKKIALLSLLYVSHGRLNECFSRLTFPFRTLRQTDYLLTQQVCTLILCFEGQSV